ncbi:MAG TPA: DNA ligase D [Stellaceae bacterium]|nr:DNA ligase D [Stellaceae bacterium]
MTGSKTKHPAGAPPNVYEAKRDFRITAEPRPATTDAAADGRSFVIQKHAAQRAGLHWDFRLEQGGTLWSWAVPKGPSLDPADRRLAIHVEDHPVGYANFEGSIPDGQYGAGAVEIWDRGVWQPLEDPVKGMRKGHLSFTLNGVRLHGRFTLARLHAKPGRKAEAWFLIKGHDDTARPGVDALTVEKEIPFPSSSPPVKTGPTRSARAGKTGGTSPKLGAAWPADGAVRRPIAERYQPQLCTVVDDPPDGSEWLSEIKFDGYRLLIRKTPEGVGITTRNGHDWTAKLRRLAEAVAEIDAAEVVLDGELVAFDATGASSFATLQDVLHSGRHRSLIFYCFDLLYLEGWDMRPCRLVDRKAVLRALAPWRGMLRYSEHIERAARDVFGNACSVALEGIICKRANAPYQPGRGRSWLKVKCIGRDEFVVLGWTEPERSRIGLGALHVGYYDRQGRLQYAGGVGSGFSGAELRRLRGILDALQAQAPGEMLLAGDPLPAITWVRPELVVEVRYAAWSGAGRLRHATYLGQREDKPVVDVVRDVADPDAERRVFSPSTVPASKTIRAARRRARILPEPAPKETTMESKTTTTKAGAKVVVARTPRHAALTVGSVTVTHPDRELWPGVTKQGLIDYWRAVADWALPEIVHRPLSILRCPDGTDGERFFQKHRHGAMPPPVRESSAAGAPYLAIDDLDGLAALVQMSTVEIHPWGATEQDPTHPDRLVFDLDPGEGVAFETVVSTAKLVRDRLEKLGLAAFCRTSGGKGLHVVVPLRPQANWDQAKPFCRAFAELMARDFPDRYVAHVKKADRRGRILIDWLRNGLGATAVASFSPRARDGATVATPLAWREVTARLDPSAFTVKTVPARLAKQHQDPWQGFHAPAQGLPDLEEPERGRDTPAGRESSIVIRPKPRPTARRSA